MAKTSFVAVLLIVAAISTIFPFAGNSIGEPAKPLKSITVQELASIEVIGWLGRPLGTIVTVEGIVADGSYTMTKADDGCTLLRIETVDGKQLPKEKVFQYSGNDKPKVGSKFKYIGYETGGFTGAPAKLFDYMPAFATTGYRFSTEFHVLRDEMKQK